MIKLEELQKAGTIKSEDWMVSNQPLNIIALNVDARFSILLYNLLFRLEGIKYGKQNVNIYLCDSKQEVTKKDVILGDFKENDVGKNRVDVLIERYGGVFTLRMYKLERERYKSAIDSFRNYGNTLILGFGRRGNKINNMFNELRNLRQDKGKYGGVAGLFGYDKGDTVGIEVKVVRKYGDVIGNFKEDREKVDGKKLARTELVKNSMVVQNMLVYINGLITEGLDGIRNTRWSYDINTGKQKNDIIIDNITIFHKYMLYGEVDRGKVEPEEVEKFSEMYTSIMNVAQEEILHKTMKYENKQEYLKMLKWTFNSWKIFIHAELETIKTEDSETKEYRDRLFMVKLIIDNVKDVEDKRGNRNKEYSQMVYTILKMIHDYRWSMT